MIVGLRRWAACRVLAQAVVVSVLILLVCSALSAAPVAERTAVWAVRTWLAHDATPLGAHVGGSVQNVTAYAGEDGLTAYYVVRLMPAGFVIVAADDRVEPIVCFSPTGTYDPSEDNPLGALVARDMAGRMSVLQSAKREFAGDEDQASAHAKWGRLTGRAFTGLVGPLSDERVPPLIQSKWSQDTSSGSACYNFYTPTGSAGSASNYPCGCVATAMAQAMRYHQHPTTGPGNKSFTITVNGSQQSRTLRGGDGWGGSYDYANMVLEPDYTTTLTQREAIGALCHDAGVAVNMSYTSSASSATLADAAKQLVDTFDYSSAVFGYNNAANIGAGLNGMINPNLDAGMPVLLGIDGADGHAVICDGYGYDLGSLYHHLNLGWEGTDDAWYNLPVVNTSQGTYTAVAQCVYNIFVGSTGEIISGRITDATGKAVVGATLTATRLGGAAITATSNTEGIYSLPGLLPSTQYTIGASKLGYVFSSSQTRTTGESQDYENTSGNIWGLNFMAAADVTAPTCTVTGPSDPTYTAPLSFAITFSEPVTGLTAGGITITGGTASSLTGDGAGYVLTVDPSGFGVITCQVPAGAAEDVYANHNTASNTVSVTYTNVGPVVAILTPTTGSSCGRTAPSIALTGSATDSDGVTSVTWSNDRGGSGACTGTTSWSVPTIALQLGANVITVTATDGIGNTETAVLTVTYATSVPGSAWQGTAMVSLPLVPDEDDPKPVVGFDQNAWHAYDPASAAYVSYPSTDTWFSATNVTVGRGFWATFPTGGVPATPAGTLPPQDQPATIHLEPGWNLIGAPFASAATWNRTAITVQETGRAPVALKDAYYLVFDYAWGWDSATSAYYLVYDTTIMPSAHGTLDPWKGYWVKAKKACDIIIPAP